MLLHAVKLAPRIFIVPDAHPANVLMSQVSQTSLVRDGGIGRQGVAALPLRTVVALIQAPLIVCLDSNFVFAEADRVRSSTQRRVAGATSLVRQEWPQTGSPSSCARVC